MIEVDFRDLGVRPDLLHQLVFVRHSAAAQMNHVDKFGMTPLLYAASIDYGDTGVLEELIAAGADVNARNKEGLTALDLAKNYHPGAIENLLAEKSGIR